MLNLKHKISRQAQHIGWYVHFPRWILRRQLEYSEWLCDLQCPSLNGKD